MIFINILQLDLNLLSFCAIYIAPQGTDTSMTFSALSSVIMWFSSIRHISTLSNEEKRHTHQPGKLKTGDAIYLE